MNTYENRSTSLTWKTEHGTNMIVLDFINADTISES